MLSMFFLPICIGCFPPPPPPPPPPPVIFNCGSVAVDVSAITTLTAFPRQGFEFGVSFDCAQVGNVIIPVPTNIRNSFSPGNSNDPCKVALQPTSLTVALGHTHPFFSNSTEYKRGFGCFGDKSTQSSSALSALNNANKNFSGNDKAAARADGRPFYLGTPTRSSVKVYRQVAGGRRGTIWRVITLT